MDLLGTTIGLFLCQKGAIVISPDDDHPVPTFLQLVLAILGFRALQMPFLAIMGHLVPLLDLLGTAIGLFCAKKGS